MSAGSRWHLDDTACACGNMFLMITCSGYHCGLTVIRVFLGVWGGGLSVWRSVQVLQLPPTVQRHAHVGVSMDGFSNKLVNLDWCGPDCRANCDRKWMDGWILLYVASLALTFICTVWNHLHPWNSTAVMWFQKIYVLFVITVINVGVNFKDLIFPNRVLFPPINC